MNHRRVKLGSVFPAAGGTGAGVLARADWKRAWSAWTAARAGGWLLVIHLLAALPHPLAAATSGGLRPAPLPADHAARMSRGLDCFQQRIRPLLVEHCLRCHGGEKTKGGLSLATRDELLKGGDDGPALVPFDAAASRLVKLVRHQEEPFMPEKQPALPDAAIRQLIDWVNDGAPYDRPLIDSRPPSRDRSLVTAEDRQWWAFQPLAKVSPPRPDGTPAPDHPIDRFILARAWARGLSLAPAADRRTLIRRVSLDLLGLPPTPEEVESFVQDAAPDAWPRLIQRLLASPHYGERWARHWLDVARFAESSGFEHDYDREGAFYYRDFVIKALNADLPYDQFVRWQLAGDEFDPDNPLALMATGFLGAGVFPTQITANEVERTRYDAMDDMLATTGSAFLGLSIGCARCHDHKFDPIPSHDYYRMLATFTTTVRSVIDLDPDPERTRERTRQWERDHAPLLEDLSAYESRLRLVFAQWWNAGARLPEAPVWTLLEITNTHSQAGATFKSLGDGSFLVAGNNGDHDTYTFVGFSPLSRITAVRCDALADPSMKNRGPGRADNGNFGLSRIRVFASSADGQTREIRLARAVADFEQNRGQLSIAASLDDDPKTGWAVDPQFGKDHSAVFTFAEPLESAGGSRLEVQLEFKVNTRHNIGRPRLAVTGEAEPGLSGEILPVAIARWLRRAATPEIREQLTVAERGAIFDWWKTRDPGWRERTARIARHDKQKPDGRAKVLICAEGFPPLRMHTQGADFFNETYYLKRGNTDLKNGVAEPGFLQVLMPATPTEVTQRWQWRASTGSKGSGRRRTLANWMTDPEHGAGALLARVEVNRLWQHHFGQGLVPTPNDFGHTGTPPTNPALLDWLAGELIRNGWRLKSIHHLILTSAAYQQATAPDGKKAEVDPANEYGVRRVPRRLEGEALRDSILAVSGQLDPTLYGPGTRNELSRRRSIYFTIKRSQLIGSMVAFDQPEPLVSQGLRPVTTVAPQALFLLNGAQVRDGAAALARRVQAEAKSGEREAQIERAYQLAIGRTPNAEETREAEAFLEAQTASYRAEGNPEASALALADFCQVLLGLNEFAYEY